MSRVRDRSSGCTMDELRRSDGASGRELQQPKARGDQSPLSEKVTHSPDAVRHASAGRCCHGNVASEGELNLRVSHHGPLAGGGGGGGDSGVVKCQQPGRRWERTPSSPRRKKERRSWSRFILSGGQCGCACLRFNVPATRGFKVGLQTTERYP